MQEALHVGVVQAAQRQHQDAQASSGQQAASLKEAQDKAASLSLDGGQPAPRPLSGSRRVSFNLESRDSEGPAPGCVSTAADTQARPISLCELREVMRKMNFTR